MSVAAAGTPAQSGSVRWEADDRVLIRDFSHVQAMARGPDRVYVATSGGLVSFDDLSGAFDLPLTMEDGWPQGPVRAMTFDERDASLWLAAADGRLLQLHPDTRRFAQELSLGEPVAELVPGERSGSDLFVRSPSGWLRVDVFLRRVSPVDTERVAAEAGRTSDARRRRELIEDPGFQAIAPFLGDAAGTRPAPVVDLVPGTIDGRFWVGTDGGFVVGYDHLTREWTPLAFGPLGEGMAAVVRDEEGLWFFPVEERSGRFAVARADDRLQRWETWPTDSVPNAPRPPLRTAAAADGVVWVGGASGLWRFEGGEWREVAPQGLPSAEVTALAVAPGTGVWVGTTRGLALLSAAGEPLGVQALVGSRVLAVTWFDGGVWVGTPGGAYVVDPATGEERPTAGPTALRRRVAALVADGGRVYAGLGAEVWRRSREEGWAPLGALGPLAGPVQALSLGDGVVWIGSDEGLVRWDPEGGEVRRFSFAAGDLPAERGRRGIHSLLPAGERAVWVATPTGALWLRAE